jgi:hemerythrin-like domain-containing protein
MPNGIDLLIAEHESVDQLFVAFEERGDGTFVGQIVDMLKAHDDAEHAVLYPMCAVLLEDDQLVARCHEAHRAVKRQIDLVVGLEGAPLVDAAKQLRGLVARHVEEEEQQLFPMLKEVASAQQLEALGAQLLRAKQRGG